MLVENVKNDLQQEFNIGGIDALFMETIYIDRDMRTKNDDDNSFVRGMVTVSQVPMPPSSSVANKRYDFRVTLAYNFNIRKEVEQLVISLNNKSNTTKTIDGKKYTFLCSLLTPNDILGASDGSGERIIYSVFNVSYIYNPFVSGGDVTLMYKDKYIPFRAKTSSYDKAIIPNITLGDNNNNYNMYGEDLELEFPILSDNSNTELNEIIGDILSNNYNKEYEFKFNYVAFERTVKLVLIGGRDFIQVNSNNILSVTGRFKFIKERTEIKIDNVTVPIFDFVPQLSSELTSQRINNINTSSNASYSEVLTFTMSNEGTVATSLLTEWKNKTRKSYAVKWKVGEIEFENNFVIQNLTLSANQNSFATIKVTMSLGV